MSKMEIICASYWMTPESADRMAWSGGNSKGAVPVHGKMSRAANIPLFTGRDVERIFNAMRHGKSFKIVYSHTAKEMALPEE